EVVDVPGGQGVTACQRGEVLGEGPIQCAAPGEDLLREAVEGGGDLGVVGALEQVSERGLRPGAVVRMGAGGVEHALQSADARVGGASLRGGEPTIEADGRAQGGVQGV